MMQRSSAKLVALTVNYQEIENNQLLALIAQQQDKLAFSELFKRFTPQIRAFLISSGHAYNGSELDDLVQESLLSVWRKAKLFDPNKAAANTWILTIARNLRIDFFRKQSKHQYDLDADDLHVESSDKELGEQADQSIMSRKVNEAITKLPIEQREVIAKVYLEEKSHQQVADELQLPLGTVKSRVRLAMQRLQNAMEKTV
jgi:RNA polymerase sigma-70 factor (ECF subfamily)